MLDGILTGDIILQGGAVTMLGAVVWMIFTGRLVTRREAEGIRNERDYWREAFHEEQRQTLELLETARVTQATLSALPQRPGEPKSWDA